MKKIARFFADPFYFTVLLILGFALSTKLITFAAGGRGLHKPDAMLGIAEGNLMALAAVIELGAMAAIFFLRGTAARCRVTLWLCAMFLAYRVGMLAYPHTSCSCFGGLSQWITVDNDTLARWQIGLLIYMTVGAVISLLLSRQVPRDRPEAATAFAGG